MSGFGAMFPNGVTPVAVPGAFAIPSPQPPSPASTETPQPPRFAGEPAHWLHLPSGTAAQAFARASRRVHRHLEGGLPDGSTGPGILLEVSPLPAFVGGALRQLAGGLPVQYALLDPAELPLVLAADRETLVAVEETLLTPASGWWLAVCFQDRVCRDPRAWAQALNDAARIGGVARSTFWGSFVNAVEGAGSPRLRALDHTGRPLRQGSLRVSVGGTNRTVTLSDAASGDTGIDLGAGSAQVSVPGAPGAVLASGEGDRSAVGAPLEVTGTDRHVLVSDADSWFAPRSAGVTEMERWTPGNEVEPIVDGIPYFARLVPELRAAKNGGAVQLAGWAFVKEGLQDKTKPWSLLPEDDSTELVPLIEELISGKANVRMLVNQFLQISDQAIEELHADAAVAVLGAYVGLGISQFAHWTTTDPAGWVLLSAGLAIIPLLPDSVLRDALRSVVELSKSTVDAVNAAHPGTAVMTPYPATLADNPLAPHPLTIAGVNVELVKHFGVYHQKIAMARPPDGDPSAFVGGIDINSDRVDDPLHRAIAPFHDVQVRLAGPAVNEIARTFAERASLNGATAPIEPVDNTGTVPAAGKHLVQIGRTYFAPGAGSDSEPFPSAPQGEHTTHDTLLRAIGAARDFIYIEDQYFTPDTAYVDALVEAAQPERGVRALLVTVPERTDQLFGGMRRGDIIHRLAEHWGERFRIGAPMRRYLNPQPGLFPGLGRMVLRGDITNADTELVLGPATAVPKPPFWAFVESELVYVTGAVGGTGTGPVGAQALEDPDPPDQTWQRLTAERGPGGSGKRWGAKADKHKKGSCVLAVQIPGIYVHAKLMVVDDIFVSIGSSNLNRRGLEHDGEINSFTVPASLKRDPRNPALRLRCRLWAEHLGLKPEMGLSLLADPLSALRYFDRSWYRGSHWQPLSFASASDPPTLAIPTGNSALGLLTGVVEGVVEAAELQNAWAAIVDPTTANDPHVDPATDRGPHL
jgi:phosphatidylserine/phosphatidylglycerophosphate/cardiolipin synthase-like enzyme